MVYLDIKAANSGVRQVAVEALRRLWREGIDSGASEPLDADDIKRRGQERLAAHKRAVR